MSRIVLLPDITSFLPSQPPKAWIHNREVAGLWHFPDYSYTFKMRAAIPSFTNFWLKEKATVLKTISAMTLVYNPTLKGWSPGSTTELTAQTEQGIAVPKDHHTLSTGNLSAVLDY